MQHSSVGTVYLLKRAEVAVRACVEVALADFDLTPSQFLMLFRLRDRRTASAADLAREIGMRPQSIIEILRPLERKQLVVRVISPGHRRILETSLTLRGRRLLAKCLRVAAKVEEQLLDGFDDRQVAALQASLARLWDRAEQHALYPRAKRARTAASRASDVAGELQSLS